MPPNSLAIGTPALVLQLKVIQGRVCVQCLQYEVWDATEGFRALRDRPARPRVCATAGNRA